MSLKSQAVGRPRVIGITVNYNYRLQLASEDSCKLQFGPAVTPGG